MAWSVHSCDAFVSGRHAALVCRRSVYRLDLSGLITIYGALFMQQKGHKSPLWSQRKMMLTFHLCLEIVEGRGGVLQSDGDSIASDDHLIAFIFWLILLRILRSQPQMHSVEKQHLSTVLENSLIFLNSRSIRILKLLIALESMCSRGLHQKLRSNS